MVVEEEEGEVGAGRGASEVVYLAFLGQVVCLWDAAKAGAGSSDDDEKGRDCLQRAPVGSSARRAVWLQRPWAERT